MGTGAGIGFHPVSGPILVRPSGLFSVGQRTRPASRRRGLSGVGNEKSEPGTDIAPISGSAAIPALEELCGLSHTRGDTDAHSNLRSFAVDKMQS